MAPPTSRPLAFSRCIRSHGVSNFPDPNSSGVWPKSQVAVAAGSPRFQAATQACGHLLPDGGPGVSPSPAVVQQIQMEMAKFARCMRSHGVPNWPDPILDRGKAVFDPEAAGIDIKSPQIGTSMHACMPERVSRKRRDSARRVGLSSLFHRRLLPLLSGHAIIDSMQRRAVLLAPALVLLAAACGGSPATSTQQNGPIAFASCMRSNGVPNWPDPDSSGAFDKSKLTSQQLGASSSRVQTAQRACSHLLPNGGSGPSAAQLQQERTQALNFSKCVRAHGVPNFPDPESSGRMRIPDPASVGINQGSPNFQAANQACGKYRPPYMPSNSEYDAYARTHPNGS